MTDQAAVVILNWNGREFLARFIPALIQYTPPDIRIVVIDNASNDDSMAFLTRNYPGIVQIKNETNLGFAGGYNEGLKKVDARYYILLNSDVEVTENWASPLISHLETHPDVAACQPTLRSHHEPEAFEYAGAAGGYIDALGYPFCRGRIFQTLEYDNGQYHNTAEVFWATGACMAISRKCFEEAGGFDAGFFAHMEEIDLCWRLKHMGYRIMAEPDSIVYHVGGGTLPKQSWRKTYLNMRNNGLMLIKNLPAGQLIPVLAIRLFLDLAAAFKFLIDGGFRNFLAVFRAHASIVRQFPAQLKKRKKIRPGKVSMVYRGSIVMDYFIARKKKFSSLPSKKFTGG
jgi:hypothetical protein